MRTATNNGRARELELPITPIENFDAELNQPLDRALITQRRFSVDEPISAIDLLSDSKDDVRNTTILNINVFDDLLVLGDGTYRVVVSEGL